MKLSSGTRLGVYEVLAPLGAGGMGEVWRARDTRLGREVAIKILPADVASDPGRLKRFEKEARSASALNHPNIVTIYDVGIADAVSWIAMERVDGKTLRELLFGGALPIRKLLPIAVQIADGLAKAHEAGIVHRDLKPENVMVTRDGLVKILDFGLAKLTATGSGSDEGSHLPTETGTSPGMVLGTVGYMSPEQAAGQTLDFRSDQFSFGSILYELATGKRAFQKKTAVDTLSAILNEEPTPVAELNPQAPAPLRWIVDRCLAKEPEGRYGTTRDLARELQTVRDHLSEAISGDALPPASKLAWTRRRGAAAVLGLALVVLAGAAVWVGRHSVKASVPTFRQLTFRRGAIAQARFAPDGTVVYSVANREGRRVELFSARSGNPESRSLGLPSANIFSISPQGEMALLLADEHPFFGTLATAPLAGGAPREILEDVNMADWAPDGKSLAVIHRVSGKKRLEFPIGKVIAESEGGLWSPKVSPNGSLLAYNDGESLVVADATGSNSRRVLRGRDLGLMLFSWSPNGDELWFAKSGERQLCAVTLEGRQRVLASLPGEFILQDVSHDGRILLERMSGSGELRGLAPGETSERDLSWLDNSEAADLSADGKTLLFTEIGSGGGANGAVYKRQTDGSPPVRLGEGTALALSPDGKWAMSKLLERLVLLPAGPGESRTLERGPITAYRSAGWYPDSRRVWFNAIEPGHGVRCYVQDIEGGQPRVVLPGGWRGGLVSPDGKLLAGFSADGEFALHPLEGDDRRPRPIPGLLKGDEFLRWSSDPGSIFMFHQESPKKARVDRVDLSSGRRELVKEFLPVEPLGSGGFGNAYLSADGKAWIYSYTRYFSDLFIVEGLR
jgi:Tol biopolymer transport system component